MSLIDIFTQVLSTVTPIFLIACTGIWYGRRHRPNIDFANHANLDLFTPMLILDVLAVKPFALSHFGALACSGALIVLGSGVLATAYARTMQLDTKTFVPPMMFNNSGNLGIPLLVLALGESMLPAAIILFVIEAVLHVTVGILMLDGSNGLKSIVRMPIVWATLAGLMLSLLQVHIPVWLATPIHLLGQIAVPLMLFTLGIRMAAGGITLTRYSLAGMWVCPLSGLIMAILCQGVFQLPDRQLAAIVLFGVLPPAVMNYIIAERYRVNPAEVAAIVMGGNLASVLIIPLTLGTLLALGIV